MGDWCWVNEWENNFDFLERYAGRCIQVHCVNDGGAEIGYMGYEPLLADARKSDFRIMLRDEPDSNGGIGLKSEWRFRFLKKWEELEWRL